MSSEINKELLEQFKPYTPLKAPKNIGKEEQLELFYKMRLIREFDTKVKDLCMDNQIYGLAHSYDNDQFQVQRRLWLSLVFDHRIIDGVPAGKFLGEVKRILE